MLENSSCPDGTASDRGPILRSGQSVDNLRSRRTYCNLSSPAFVVEVANRVHHVSGTSLCKFSAAGVFGLCIKIASWDSPTAITNSFGGFFRRRDPPTLLPVRFSYRLQPREKNNLAVLILF
ncbi:hypothetical protein EVAR_67537_1 [Eumeta japonica]|uniref:Uncharacterized protein n=1 Tax=Eumeta variegata TaxID=151549 RepID=A0A4C1ZYB3_EUMVA|nr:hypothetical protein EVAR_67537_1 [Eumeta japonica]